MENQIDLEIVVSPLIYVTKNTLKYTQCQKNEKGNTLKVVILVEDI